MVPHERRLESTCRRVNEAMKPHRFRLEKTLCSQPNVLHQQALTGVPLGTRRNKMKRFMIVATAALLSSGAFAQTATVELAPEQRTKIKQYVTTQKVAPVTVKEKVSVGSTLPADVRLSPVPADWGPSVSKYQYIYSDNHVYFVEPSTRKVVTVID
jgi:hypothetical protein